MTTSQYLTAWAMYYAAVIGCLVVWWRLTRPLNATVASWLRLIATVLLCTPGYADPDRLWLSPAMLSIGYEVLNDGPQGLSLNGVILMVFTTLALIVKGLFFRQPLRLRTFLSRHAKQDDRHTQKTGPSLQKTDSTTNGKVILYREHTPSPKKVHEKTRIEPNIS